MSKKKRGNLQEEVRCLKSKEVTDYMKDEINKLRKVQISFLKQKVGGSQRDRINVRKKEVLEVRK